jgi:hypothetical protein
VTNALAYIKGWKKGSTGADFAFKNVLKKKFFRLLGSLESGVVVGDGFEGVDEARLEPGRDVIKLFCGVMSQAP